MPTKTSSFQPPISELISGLLIDHLKNIVDYRFTAKACKFK